MYHLNQPQLSSQDLMNLDSILRLAALRLTHTHTRSPSHTHLNRPGEAAWALPQRGSALCYRRNWKSVIMPLIGGGVFSQTFPSSHQHFLLPLTSREKKKPPATAAPSPTGPSTRHFPPLRSDRCLNPAVFPNLKKWIRIKGELNSPVQVKR